MKKTIFIVVLMLCSLTISVFAHGIVVGQTYEYEWTITNTATGAVISTGTGTVVPSTNRGVRSVEHYIRKNVLGWNSNTRTIDGVRQRVTVRILDDEECDD